MSNDKMQTLHQFEMGDQLKIHLAENTEVGGTTLSTPYTTTVSSVRKKRLDHNRGDDVDGIVHRREIYIEPHPDDDVHEEYVITTEAPIIGQKYVSSIDRVVRKFLPVVTDKGSSRYSVHRPLVVLAESVVSVPGDQERIGVEPFLETIPAPF